MERHVGTIGLHELARGELTVFSRFRRATRRRRARKFARCPTSCSNTRRTASRRTSRRRARRRSRRSRRRGWRRAKRRSRRARAAQEAELLMLREKVARAKRLAADGHDGESSSQRHIDAMTKAHESLSAQNDALSAHSAALEEELARFRAMEFELRTASAERRSEVMLHKRAEQGARAQGAAHAASLGAELQSAKEEIAELRGGRMEEHADAARVDGAARDPQPGEPAAREAGGRHDGGPRPGGGRGRRPARGDERGARANGGAAQAREPAERPARAAAPPALLGAEGPPPQRTAKTVKAALHDAEKAAGDGAADARARRPRRRKARDGDRLGVQGDGGGSGGADGEQPRGCSTRTPPPRAPPSSPPRRGATPSARWAAAAEFAARVAAARRAAAAGGGAELDGDLVARADGRGVAAPGQLRTTFARRGRGMPRRRRRRRRRRRT